MPAGPERQMAMLSEANTPDIHSVFKFGQVWAR